ncbi:MAG: DUF58 domain-containing protein [Bacillota bacterium]|nr:DUF58 domain-containing protein [Bacillota bacterium]
MFRIKIKFIILFALFAASAYFEGGPLFYRILYAFAAIMLLAVVVIFLNKKYLDVDILFERNVYSTGDNGRFTMVLNNRGLLPVPYLIVMNSALKKLSSRYNGDAVFIGTGSSKKLRYEVRFRNRGVYNFGETEVRFRDTAAIMERRGTYTSKTLIHVYPRIVTLRSNLFKGINLFNNYKLSPSGIEDLHTIRDNRKYREGDSLKRINWKVSAKYNDLYVKNLEVLIGEEFNVFLDMNSCNYKYDNTGVVEEQLVDTCASIVHHLSKRKIISRLFINAQTARSFDIKDRKDFEQLMDYFMMTKSDSDMPYLSFLRAHLNKDASMNNIALITARVDQDILEYVMELEERKKNIFLFFNVVEGQDGVNIVKLRKLGVVAIDASQLVK